MADNLENTDSSQPNQDDARDEALQRVVERVTSWQESATDGTIAAELESGLRDAGITLTADQQERLVQQISDGEHVDVADYSASAEGGPA